jgi:hypothetical protein
MYVYLREREDTACRGVPIKIMDSFKIGLPLTPAYIPFHVFFSGLEPALPRRESRFITYHLYQNRGSKIIDSNIGTPKSSVFTDSGKKEDPRMPIVLNSLAWEYIQLTTLMLSLFI